MPWSSITAQDVESALNAGELEQYRRHAATIEDPLPIIIGNVIAQVRGFIGVRHPLDGDGIPDELRAVTLDLIVHHLAKRVAKGGEADADRAAAAGRAMEILRAVADGRFSIGALASSTTSRWGSEVKFTT